MNKYGAELFYVTLEQRLVQARDARLKEGFSGNEGRTAVIIIRRLYLLHENIGSLLEDLLVRTSV